MSKERLDEIIEQVKKSDEYAEMRDWEASDSYLVELHNEGHINYLIERVQELEKELTYYKMATESYLYMEQENKRYREAIKRAIGKFNYDYHQEGMAELQKALEE